MKERIINYLLCLGSRSFVCFWFFFGFFFVRNFFMCNIIFYWLSDSIFVLTNLRMQLRFREVFDFSFRSNFQKLKWSTYPSFFHSFRLFIWAFVHSIIFHLVFQLTVNFYSFGLSVIWSLLVGCLFVGLSEISSFDC